MAEISAAVEPKEAPEDPEECDARESKKEKHIRWQASVLRQVRYYFSDENLPTDDFLLNEMAKTKEGWVKLSVVCKFSRMTKLKAKPGAVAGLVAEGAPELEISQSGKNAAIRRRVLPVEVSLGRRSVRIVDGVEGHDVAAVLRARFSPYGEVESVVLPGAVEDPGAEAAGDGGGSRGSPKGRNSLPHVATVVLCNEEAAARAVREIGQNSGWRRGGMRVQLQVPSFTMTIVEKTRRESRAGSKVKKPKERNNAAENRKAFSKLKKAPPPTCRQQQRTASEGPAGAHVAILDTWIRPLRQPRGPDGTAGFSARRGT